MKPVIALTYTNNEQKHENYVRWLMAGADVEIITLSVENDNIADLRRCQGLVFSGGTDVHPSFYGKKKKDYANAPKHFDKARDHFETAVFAVSQEMGLPVLAICRGMQLVNSLLGGKLVQDLGRTGNAIHRAHDGRDKAHGLQVVEGSLLHEIMGTNRCVVNAAHHQAIKKPGKGLRVNAFADDGTIEGIEWEERRGRPFLLGVQWHPERMFAFELENSPAAIALRDRFIKEVLSLNT